MRKARTSPLIVLVLLGAIGLGGCGSSGTREVTIQKETPRLTMVEAANLDGLHSGEAEVVFGVFNLTHLGGTVVRFNGSFAGLGEESIPEFQVSAGAKTKHGNRSAEFNGRIFHSGNGTVLVYGPAFKEVSYQPGAAALKALEGKVEAAQGEAGGGNLTACIDAARGFDFGPLVHELEFEKQFEEPDGVQVFVVRGELKMARFLDELIRLREDPGCGAQMAALGLPSAAQFEAVRPEVRGGVEEAPIRIGVDKHGMLREFSIHAYLRRPDGERFEMKVEWKLWRANQPVNILISPGEKPFGSLLGKLGTNLKTVLRVRGQELVIGFLEGLSQGVRGYLS